MPTPDELYGSSAKGAAPSTAATGGAQEYVSPNDIYGQPVNQPPSKFWEQVKEDVPALAGATAYAPPFATAGATIGTAIMPGPGTVIGGLVGGAIGAGIGGAGGKGYQIAYREATGSDKAPDNSYDAAVEIAKAGGEQAAWELGGQLIAKGIGKGIYYLRPKAVEGIEKLNVALEKAGGRLTAAQRTDSWAVHQLDSLTRGSLTGSGTMKAADRLNDQALRTITKEVQDNIAKSATQNLPAREIGDLFMDTISGGQTAHKTAVKNMYESFDTLVPQKVVTEMQQAGVDAAGQPIMKPVQTAIQPVQTSAVKEAVAPLRDQLERINYIGESAESKKLLESISVLPDRLSFSDAQALRSNLLDAQRNLEGSVGKSKISGKINTLVDGLTKSMDDAASQQGSAVYNKYQAIKRFASTGYQAFNNDFVASLMKAGETNPSDIGATLFAKGNEQQILDAKKALRYASRFGEEQGISYDKTWNQMQVGYLNDILTRNSKLSEIPAGATQENIQQGMLISGKDLLKEFTDPSKKRVLNRVFSTEQRDSILELAKVAERVQRKPQGGLGMVASFTQGGFIAAALTGTFEASKAASLFISPWAMSKIMTSPSGARTLAIALETPAKSPKAAATLSKLAFEAAKANKAEEQ